MASLGTQPLVITSSISDETMTTSCQGDQQSVKFDQLKHFWVYKYYVLSKTVKVKSC